MGLLIRLTFEVTLIFLVIINRSDGFMFSAWLRSTTERSLSTLGQNRHQNYATNQAAHSRYAYAYAPVFASKKDSGKANVVATSAAATPTDKDVIAAYNNQRTGISPPPPKYDKPWNGYDGVVVHSIASAASAVPSLSAPVPSPAAISYVAIPAQYYHPYLYYRDETRAQPAQNVAASSATTSAAPPKSVNVELNYKDESVVEKVGENVVLNRKISPPQVPVALDSTQLQPGTESSVSSTAAASEENSSSRPAVSDSSSKINVPSRPIKLLGPHAVYAAPPAPANLTFAPQFYYAPALAPVPAPAAADIQYVRYPFLGPSFVAPVVYKNTPRAVSDRSEIVPPPPSASQLNIPKPEKPICENCLLPSALANYPCTQESSATAAAHPDQAIAPTFKSPNMAYIFVPPQMTRNRAS